MLFQHFSCTDLDKNNFIKMCDCIIAWEPLQIDHDELYSVVYEKGVDGRAFDEMDVVEFQGLFEAFSDNDHVADLHQTLMKWKYTESAVFTPGAGPVPSFSRYSSVNSQGPDLDNEPSAVEQLMKASVPFISAVMHSVAELQNHKFEKGTAAKMERFGGRIIDFFLLHQDLDGDKLSTMPQNEFGRLIAEHCESRRVRGITSKLLKVTSIWSQ